MTTEVPVELAATYSISEIEIAKLYILRCDRDYHSYV